MTRYFLGFLFLLQLGGEVRCQTLLPPVVATITSDYGPRNLQTYYNWHWGVDYGAPMWTPVSAVENGRISEIGYTPPPADGWSSGWYLKVSTDTKIWAYLHLSTGVANNNPISPDGGFEIKSVTLENPGDASQTLSRYAFIFWVNKSLKLASKVLVASDESDAVSEWHVRWGTGYILDAVSGSSITTISNIAANTMLAYSGSSGNVPAHLDLRVKTDGATSYNVNPLYYVQHESPYYGVGVSVLGNTPLFHISNLAESVQSGERVWANVLSYVGLDLDRAELYLFSPSIPGDPNDYTDASLAAKIVYGGKPPESTDSSPNPAEITMNGYRGSETRTGIDPQGSAGDDDLYFVGFNTKVKSNNQSEALLSRDAKFPDGDYGMVMRAHSVRYNNSDYIAGTAWEEVAVDNFRPYVERVRIADSADLNAIRYDRQWELHNSTLVPVLATDNPLLPGGSYNVRVFMSEFTDWPGLRLENGPDISVQDGADYTDTHTSEYAATLQVPQYTEDKVVPLLVNATDYAGNLLLAIAAGRKEIMPALELTRNSGGTMQGTPGEDGFHYIRVDAASPVISYNRHPSNYPGYDYTCPGGIPERCGTEENPINITFSSVPFLYTDLGSGVHDVVVYKEYIGGTVAAALGIPSGDKYVANTTMSLKDGKYVQVVTDNLGRGTTMYFRIDPVSPRLEISSITISSPFTTYSVYGVVVDTGSGMDYLSLSGAGTFGLQAGSTEPVNFSFTSLNVDSTGYYTFTAQDKGENVSFPQPVMQFTQGTVEGTISQDSNAVVHRITRVLASGGPCTVTVTSTRNVLAIPVEDTIPDENPIVAELTTASTYFTEIAFPDKYMHGNLAVSVSTENACAVELKGVTLLAATLGPRLASVRYGDEPTRFDLTLSPDWWRVDLENISWATGVVPTIVAAAVAPPAPPEGLVNYPPESPRALRLEVANATYDRIALASYGLAEWMTPAEKASVRMLKYKDGTVSDITSGFEDNAIFGSTLDNCTFTLVAPIDIFDKAGPLVTFNSPSGAYVTESALYVGTSTLLSLMATDASSNSYALAGVATTYYLVDAEPTPECLSTTFVPSAPGGTCANPVYIGAFTVQEGTHSIYYTAVDRIGNAGSIGVSSVAVDGTPPEISLALNGVPITAGSTVQTTVDALLSLSATDYYSGGLASGLTTSYFLVDISPEECEYLDWFGGVNGVGTCRNPFYSGPMTMPEGEHTIYYTAEDNVGNRSVLRSVHLEVSGVDTLPPVTSLLLDSAIANPGVVRYVKPGVRVEFNAQDSGGSGLDVTTFTIANIGGETPVLVSSGVYSGPLYLTVEGDYGFFFSSIDLADNEEAMNSREAYVDGTAPTASAEVNGDVLADGATVYAMAGDTVTLSASDPVSGGVASGVWHILYTVDLAFSTGTAEVYGEPFATAPGTHTLFYAAMDNAGNLPAARTFDLVVLSTPEIQGISPSSGPIGMPFAITGTGFGVYSPGESSLLLAGATVPVSLWTDTRIESAVPEELTPGGYELYVERAFAGGALRSSTFTFTVATPYLSGVSPSTAAVLAPFVISGYNFGDNATGHVQVLINGATSQLTLWTDTRIEGKLPQLSGGQYPVLVRRVFEAGLAESSTGYINVEEPVISSMTPESGAVETEFDLYGSGFGSYDENITRVTMGGELCALSSWTATHIIGTVPSELSYGTHTVVVLRGQTSSNSKEFYIPEGYRPSMLRPGLTATALLFRLGEVYVYPDPAKGGKVPTFHIEVGTADSVKLRIYTVAGQLVHERTITGNPQAIGSVYAYEYAWSGRIASGVYYYSIEAERSGKKLKTKGRFSVVR